MNTFGILLSVVAGLSLALWNGANDNFKGVATLLGSKTTSYRIALVWATVTTLLGSFTALYLASELMVNFSGKGLVPDEVLQLKIFAPSVCLGAGMTVFLATRLGFPISTTHSIIGALVGSGYLASPQGLNFTKLFSTFFLPLLSSPFIAALGVAFVYPFFTLSRKKIGIGRESCLCIGNEILELAPSGTPHGPFQGSLTVECGPVMKIGTIVTCEERYTGHFMGIKAKAVLDTAHFLSSGLVGFARGLNDTPKIAAILLAGSSLSIFSSIAAVSVSIALGGIIFSKRIAETMAFNITKMNDGQGFTTNLVTSSVVILASRFGMPVSTTHVSCGALFGLGSITRQADWRSISKIVLSWLITLPAAAMFSYLFFALLKLIPVQ